MFDRESLGGRVLPERASAPSEETSKPAPKHFATHFEVKEIDQKRPRTIVFELRL